MPPESPCKLSIVVLNYNSGSLLSDCLDSLFESGLPGECEVLVPDNGSTDTSLTAAKNRWGGRIRIIYNNANKGFAWGNNIGIRESRGEYVCLLNPDTVIYPGAFQTLVDFMEAHPRCGFAGPKVLNSDGTLQLSCRRMIPSPFDAIARALLLSKLFPKSRRFSRYNVTYLDENASQRVDASTGCCMLARRSMLEEIGLLDEGYFIYCEDIDWFQRAKVAGWEVWYVSTACIEHHHAYSEKFRRYDAVRDFHQSMIRFYRKHYAAQYPAFFNGLIYAAVFARMGLIMGSRTLNGWR
jgi:GT2 family glycosyltransferase